MPLNAYYALVGPLPFFLWKKIAIGRVAVAHPGPGGGPERTVEALDDWVGTKIVPSRDHGHFIDDSLSLDSFRVR
jgi:hypothetical protein